MFSGWPTLLTAAHSIKGRRESRIQKSSGYHTTSESSSVYKEFLLASLELKLACIILKIAKDSGEDTFHSAIRLAKFVVILGIQFGLLPSCLIIINHFGPYPWAFNLILENAHRIKAIHVDKSEKPYKYLSTQEGEKIANSAMFEMDDDKRRRVIKTIGDLIKRYRYNKYKWWHLEDKLITESYMVFAGSGKGQIRKLNGHKIVKLFKFNYKGNWTKYHSTLFHRFVALHADPSIKMYRTKLKPMTPLLYEEYIEPFVWENEKPLRIRLKNKSPYDKRLSEDKIQTKNCILNKWEIMEAIWLYQVLTGNPPSVKEIGFLCLCQFRLEDRPERMRKRQEKALRYSLNALEDYGLIMSFEGIRKRYSVLSRHFWDEIEEECFSLPHPLDILENCQRIAHTINNAKLSKIFARGIQNFKSSYV